MICPCCLDDHQPIEAGSRGEIFYDECADCGTIYTKMELNPETENDNSVGRNTQEQMQIRYQRVKEFLKEAFNWAIDFGCGEGEFQEFLWHKDIATSGIDIHTNQQLCDEEGPDDAVFMIEVIEHLSEPRKVLTELASKLRVGGVLYIETTFADHIKDPSTHPYVDPRIGHRTIVSRKGLDSMMQAAGLEIAKDVNRNVIILRKLP